MKSVQSILPHLFPNKKDKIKEHKCFNRFISSLPKNIKEHTLFCFKKDMTLFLVLDHPGIKMEFNYNQKVINEILNIAKLRVDECKNIEINSIKAIVSNRQEKKFEKKEKSLNKYKEISSANFKNFAANSEIKDMIEIIRKKIIEIKENE